MMQLPSTVHPPLRRRDTRPQVSVVSFPNVFIPVETRLLHYFAFPPKWKLELVTVSKQLRGLENSVME